MKKILIIGGTSGLGLAMAEQFASAGHVVAITGRKNKSLNTSLQFYPFDLTSPSLYGDVASLITAFGHIDYFVYAAGFCQHATTAELAQDDIDHMISVGLTAPVYLLREILTAQNSLELFVAITSTSEWTAREYEPVYAAVKSGLGMYAKSVALDSAVEHVLVVGPAGMKTSYWDASDMDTSAMLDASWVADHIIQHIPEVGTYRHVRVLREPPRVVVDTNI